MLYPVGEKLEKPRATAGSIKDAEIYVRHNQRQYENEHGLNRQLSDFSYSTSTLNTQMSSESSVPTINKPHSILHDTLSGVSVVTSPADYLESSTTGTFSSVTPLQNGESPNSNTMLDSEDLSSQIPTSKQNDSVKDLQSNNYSHSGLGEDSPKIGHVILKIKDDSANNSPTTKAVHFEENVS